MVQGRVNLRSIKSGSTVVTGLLKRAIVIISMVKNHKIISMHKVSHSFFWCNGVCVVDLERGSKLIEALKESSH